MSDVGPIVAFALHDEAFGPDHILRWTETNAYAQNLALSGMVKPDVIDSGNAVAGAVDDVDKRIVAVHLAQPMGKRALGVIASGAHKLESLRKVFLSKKHVQVLGMPLDSGVACHRIGAPHKEGDLRARQDLQRGAVKFCGRRLELALRW